LSLSLYLCNGKITDIVTSASRLRKHEPLLF